MNAPHTPFSSQAPRSPLREQSASILFMAFLLIVSALTATIVGYRVKSADIDRKGQLLAAYTALGGSFERVNTLGFSLYDAQAPAERNTFILAYEVNSRARMHGLYRVLETTPAERMDDTIRSLDTIEATESARSTEDAWKTFSAGATAGNTPSINQGVNATAARFARQYDRYLARDTEVKLFRYLRDHRDTIKPH